MSIISEGSAFAQKHVASLGTLLSGSMFQLDPAMREAPLGFNRLATIIPQTYGPVTSIELSQMRR